MLGQQNTQRPMGGGANKCQHNYRSGRQEEGDVNDTGPSLLPRHCYFISFALVTYSPAVLFGVGVAWFLR